MAADPFPADDRPDPEPGLADARARLAAGQQALLAALVAGGTAPDGFDPERLRVQARSLTLKRTRVAAAHHPWLAEALGADHAVLFARYAHTHPLTAGRSGHADAAAFEAYLRDTGVMPKRPRGLFRRR